MKKIIIALMVLGLIAIGTFSSADDQTRTIPHKFRAFTTKTAVAQGATIFRITGYASGSAAIYGVYNCASLAEMTSSVVAVEGGEATSGDPLTPMYFGEEGLSLDSGMSVSVYNCTIVIEYI